MISNKIKIFKSSNIDPGIDEILGFITRHRSERFKMYEENENYIIQENLKINEEFLDKESNGTFSGIRNKNNIADVIVKTHLSYFMGEDVKVKGNEDDQDAIDIYNIVSDYNDFTNINFDIAEYMGKFGNAFQLIWSEDSIINVAAVDPREAFVVYDYSVRSKPIYGVRFYTDQDDNLNIEVYGKNYNKVYINYSGSNPVLVDEKINIYNEVQLIEYKNNNNLLCDFNPVKTYIDDINKTITSQSDSVHYMSDAFLVFSNTGIDEESIKILKDVRSITINNPDEGSPATVSFLEKPVNVENSQNHLKNLETFVYRESYTPNISFEDLTKIPSGKALEIMYLNAEFVANIKEKEFRKGFIRLLDIIFSIASYGKSKINYDSLTIDFNRSLPSITTSEIDDLMKVISFGVLSNKTILENIPAKYIKSVEEELSRLEQNIIDFGVGFNEDDSTN